MGFSFRSVDSTGKKISPMSGVIKWTFEDIGQKTGIARRMRRNVLANRMSPPEKRRTPFSPQPGSYKLPSIMGKTLFWYITREVLVPFGMGLFVFTFVLLMFQILKLTEMVVSYGVSVWTVCKIMAYILPPFFVFTVPMSFLLGVMLAISRLSSDSEFTAIKASGISLYQMLPPVMMMAFGAYLVSAFLTVYGEPWGKQSFKIMLAELGRRKATIGITERIFNDQFNNMIMYVNEVEPGTGELKQVFIADEREKNNTSVVIASHGTIVSSEQDNALVLALKDGSIHRMPPENRIDYENVRFGAYDILIDMNSPEDEDESEKTYLEMNLTELKHQIAVLKAQKNDYMYRRAWTEYHRKFAFPFSCLVFGIVGLTLGINPPRSGRSRGFTVAIMVIAIYYLLFRGGENMGWKAVAHPAVCMWMPNTVLLIFGLVLLHKKANEIPIKSIDWLMYQWEKIGMWIEQRLNLKFKLVQRFDDDENKDES